MTRDERKLWTERLTPKQRGQFEERIRQLAGDAAQRELIQVIANGDFAFFQKHWAAKMYRIDATEFAVIREQLRQIWKPQVSTENKNRILNEWLQSGNSTAVADWERGHVFVNHANLRAELATITLSNKNGLAFCLNPDCPNPYFIAAKKGRKYCEQGGCTIYAQRKYARESWQRKHGKSTDLKKERAHGFGETR